MTRIVQAMAGQAHGGAEVFFERLASALQRAGETQLLAIRQDRARAERLACAGCEVIELPFGGAFDFATKPRLARAIAAFRPRVVLSWMSRAANAVAGGDYVHVGRLGGYYDLKYYRSCDHLVANTRDIERYLVRSGWPAARAHYLPNFADPPEGPALERGRFDTPPDAPLAVAMGRLHRNKGFDVLLAALAKTPHLYLWLAGEGEERAALEQLAATLGVGRRVRFLGWRDDPGAVLAAADMLVSSSRHEPLGNVVLEAWAARVPVVATHSEGPGALIRDGETGLLVPLEDDERLAAALTRLADDADLRARLAAAGHAEWRQSFGEERVVGIYRDFLARVER
ncbi:MAG TPA: glycosyltransferase [Stellaceae bacterium]|nr:glycosyltransferase [Stellaceae bacterium]